MRESNYDLCLGTQSGMPEAPDLAKTRKRSAFAANPPLHTRFTIIKAPSVSARAAHWSSVWLN